MTGPILCVIPVRSGSKGVPGKNIKPLGGKPLVAWTIEQALSAEAGLDVLVSTDSPQIAEVARSYGAHVPFLRPEHLAHDTTPTEPVIEHALAYRRAEGIEPEAVMLLQATSPFRLPGTLDAAITQFRESGADSLVGVVPMPPFIWRTTAHGKPAASYDVANRLRRQDMGPADMRYRENGSLYITRPHVYDREHNRLGGTISMFVLNEIEGVDIDTDIDFRLAVLQVDDYLNRLSTEGALS
ncbi:MAG: acylneuraminate cytidylyltransferase family protein [Bowdeniella nasicola]|nr:acylneuraminate cytidylyltransferase family protein [Bowdeniella nasicola]